MEIKPLPSVPVLDTGTDKSTRNAFGEAYGRVNQLIKKMQTMADAVLPHKATHATGGTDAIIPADIGAATADHTHTFPTVPAGAVMTFAMNAPPAGWLKCNGDIVSRTTYAALFAAIGTTYGAGDGSTTFNVPDLRGEFARGWDDGRGMDASRVFGSGQADTFQGHYHHVYQCMGAGSISTSNNSGVIGGNETWNTHMAMAKDMLSDGTNGTPRTAAETRPRNIALLYCIKY